MIMTIVGLKINIVIYHIHRLTKTKDETYIIQQTADLLERTPGIRMAVLTEVLTPR